MNLQIALDRLTDEECMTILSETNEYVDWIEIGTGVIKEYGMSIVRRVRDHYPDAVIVADMKTCDAGAHEAAQVFEAGADITTVMAFAADQTIKDMVQKAKECSGRIMVDLLNVADSGRVTELHTLGIDLVSLHFGKDMQQNNEMDQSLFELVKDSRHLEVAVAGGINLQSLPAILSHQPDTVIAGSAITKAKDHKEAAKKMKEVIQSYETNNTHR
ncbi:3-hexulose-6-phosphate synthase [Halobacillus sp. A5]|uniref:3-hexulose-6-phosphate synthase n=1 Tax=Halobacillus sp. A5 TaxID=2880263 RepID=UPI0020A6BFD9|nr:3-hexulose-6-phosphate synthase [Halobacillus sp. A5]MCP3027365.1 orotidine 5'-phosphate decarboxylase [Halobacillus sp. A5]